MLASAASEAVQTHYRKRLGALEIEQQHVVARRQRHRIFLTACSALFLFLGLNSHSASPWIIAVPALAFAASLPAYVGLQNELLRIQRLQVFYDTGIERVDGTNPQSGHTGEEFHSSSHLYDRDLDILGSSSLFGLLATTRTGIGRRGLAHLLLDPVTPAEVLRRQQCAQELTPLTELREQLALLGPSRFQDAPASAFDSWLADSPPRFHRAITPALVLISIAVLSLLFCGIFNFLPWTNIFAALAICFAIQGILFLSVKSRVLPILNASRVSSQMQLFHDGVDLFLKQRFNTPYLQQLQQILREPIPALPALRRIQNQFVIVEQLQKEYAVVLSIPFSTGTHAAINIANWKHTYAAAMAQWTEAWASCEALCAIANYAFEHPQDVFPTFSPLDEPAVFHASELGHPLIPSAICVRNDIALDASTRFYLISGSNMAGKSTLLRSIGLNAVLSYAGAPVRATSLHLTFFTIGASLALTDSLADGKSKFLAEVERLSAILAAGKQSPTLFLIDELFSGTNSHDRAIAAAAVLRDLLHSHSIGALSTHDLALTDLATPQTHGINVHMASPDPNDPLAFDFLLKPGVNPTSNALAIVRMMGIDPGSQTS
jgi:DNA mismatch repair ATPase MutS